MRKRFDGPFPFGRSSLCHLRLFERADETVALAIEIDDNPGMSISNAAEALWEAVLVTFGISDESLRLLLFFPAAELGSEETWTEYVGEAAGFRRTTRHEAEALVDAAVTPRGPCSYRAEALWPRHPVLQLIPEEGPELALGERLTLAAVTELPFAHLPARCAHRERFDRLLAALPADSAASEAAGAQFYLTLTPGDLADCPYHRGDWRGIADASVEVLARLPAEGDIDDVLRLADALLDDDTSRRWLASLFTDPIIFAAGAPAVTNGQHRACALRCSGAGRAAVEVTDRVAARLQPDEQASDPARRACGVLAAFWARRASMDDPLGRGAEATSR